MTTMSSDRVRAHTTPHVNRCIDEAAKERVKNYAGTNKDEMARRIEELDREWDIERVLETNASSIAFAGLVAGMVSNRKWLILPGLVLPFLLLHALQGWCPPLPILRRLGVRTRKEIDAEKYALKALRGDFQGITGSSSGSTALDAAKT